MGCVSGCELVRDEMDIVRVKKLVGWAKRGYWSKKYISAFTGGFYETCNGYLDLGNVRDDTMPMIIECLQSIHDKLTELNIEGNEITERSAQLLMTLIESSHVTSLSLPANDKFPMSQMVPALTVNQIRYGSSRLVLPFTRCNGCSGYYLPYSYATDEMIIKICEAIKIHGMEKLESIDLGNPNNMLTSKGASMLFNTLRECNSVVSMLDLSKNRIDDECMIQLGEYIQDNEHVEELRLGNNKITDKGVEILSEYLIGNIILKQLNLSNNNGITDASVPYFLEIAKLSCVTCLHLSNTSTSEIYQNEIIHAFSIPIDQREIELISKSKSAAKSKIQQC